MKTFLVLLKDKSQADLEESLLLDHIEHLKQLSQAGQLLVCGPFIDNSGAVLVIQASSQSEAERIVQADPFIKAGYYGGYTMREFYKADASNQYLLSE